jgi:hypothetical protein
MVSSASNSRVQPLPAAPGDALHSTTFQLGASQQNMSVLALSKQTQDLKIQSHKRPSDAMVAAK